MTRDNHAKGLGRAAQEARRAAALRANLRRRKAQSRARDGGQIPDEPGAPGSSEPDVDPNAPEMTPETS